MQEFSQAEILSLLSGIKTDTFEISSLLAEENQELSKKAAELYNKRKQKIVILKEWINSEKGKSFILSNKERWKESIETIIEEDKINFEKVKAKVRKIGADIQSLYMNKNLLIYTKK